MASTASISQNIDSPAIYQSRWAAATLTTANTARDGTGTVSTIFTAATNGSVCSRIALVPLGTNVASVARFFVNNGATTATATNNSLIGEVSLPATTATEVEAQTTLYFYPAQLLLTTERITCCIGTAVAAGWQITAMGGDF